MPNFYADNAWSWTPPQTFDYVYTLIDVVPTQYLENYLARLRTEFVAPGGTLILGAYGSESRQQPAPDVATTLEDFGFEVVGTSRAGAGPTVQFAWTTKPLS